MFKRNLLVLLGLALALTVLGPAKANAGVVVGVTIGAPVYVGPGYYSGYGYDYPRAYYAPGYYAPGYYAPGYGYSPYYSYSRPIYRGDYRSRWAPRRYESRRHYQRRDYYRRDYDRRDWR